MFGTPLKYMILKIIYLLLIKALQQLMLEQNGMENYNSWLIYLVGRSLLTSTVKIVINLYRDNACFVNNSHLLRYRIIKKGTI